MIRWTSEKKAKLKQMWLDGYMIKTIRRELECGETSVKDQVKKLGLPARQRRGPTLRPTIHMRMNEAMYEATKRAAFQRNMSTAAYVRFLVRRDIGDGACQSNTSIVVHHDRGELRVVL